MTVAMLAIIPNIIAYSKLSKTDLSLVLSEMYFAASRTNICPTTGTININIDPIPPNSLASCIDPIFCSL